MSKAFSEVEGYAGDPRAEAIALTQAVGLVDLSARTRIELAGRDRASFLHNMCTNDIKRLAPGSGCEAMLTDARGHVLQCVFVLASEESLLLNASPGQAERLIAHLDRYIIREDVQLIDRTADCGELLVAGPRAAALLGEALGGGVPTEMLASRAMEIGEASVVVARMPWSARGAWSLLGARAPLEQLWLRFNAAGAPPCGSEAFDALRIEAGVPIYGHDITDKTLPQELARDAQAISFTKGCYIGQETVARIDALGHVNRTLAGVRFSGAEVPSPGDELSREGQAVGQVTSACFSPTLNAPLALAWLRRGSNTPGAQVQSAVGVGEVIALPI